MRLIVFVGTFGKNAFAMGLKDGVNTIAIPMEDSDLEHAITMTHEAGLEATVYTDSSPE